MKLDVHGTKTKRRIRGQEEQVRYIKKKPRGQTATEEESRGPLLRMKSQLDSAGVTIFLLNIYVPPSNTSDCRAAYK